MKILSFILGNAGLREKTKVYYFAPIRFPDEDRSEGVPQSPSG